jgi:hypothetical protein
MKNSLDSKESVMKNLKSNYFLGATLPTQKFPQLGFLNARLGDFSHD